MPKDLPPPETLRKLLRYDPATGRLFWLDRDAGFFRSGGRTGEGSAANWNAKYANKEALTSLDAKGHRRGEILGVSCYAHRVIWAMETGAWPKDQIDHINGDPADNRIGNLRDVDGAENMRNQKRRSSNASGVNGVYWHSRDGKWMAKIVVSYKQHHLGGFDCVTAAMIARKLAEEKYGFHKNHGRKVNG